MGTAHCLFHTNPNLLPSLDVYRILRHQVGNVKPTTESAECQRLVLAAVTRPHHMHSNPQSSYRASVRNGVRHPGSCSFYAMPVDFERLAYRNASQAKCARKPRNEKNHPCMDDRNLPHCILFAIPQQIRGRSIFEEAASATG
jgi:hypothetical protein